MATYRKRGKTWRVEVTVKGARRSATFTTKEEAKRWAAKEETGLRDEANRNIPDKPFRDLMERYEREVTPSKRGAGPERKMIGRMLRDPLMEVSLRDLAPRDMTDWRDRRLSEVGSETVRRQMTVLSHACNIARREWGWLSSNPCSDVRRPPSSPARTRRPMEEETSALLLVLGYASEVPPRMQIARVGLAWLFAIETGMRAGEICNLTWNYVFDRHVYVAKSKNGYPRDVPLSRAANELLDQLRPVTGDGESVFSLTASNLDALFRKAKRRAMVTDLHFHDSRREALTRLSKIYGVMELAKISGHRDLRTLQNVYYRPTIEELTDKLYTPDKPD